MKLLLILSLLLSMPVCAQVEFTVDYSGVMSNSDGFAARHLVARRNLEIDRLNARIDRDNKAITAENNQRALAEPPLDPLPLTPLVPVLPIATDAELKASYMSLLAVYLTNYHKTLARQQAEEESTKKLAARWQAASQAERAAALEALPTLP